MAKTVKRLFEQFQPSSYQLDLVPDRDKMTFSGSVVINGRKVGPPSQRLTFHCKDLKITEAQVIKIDKQNERKFKLSRTNVHKNLNELRLHTTDKIFPGQYTVELKFTGKITKPMDGIYPCFFKHNGKDKKLIATQFESHFARQVFPCIDEPEAKAAFDLTLTTPKGETVISNTPIKKQTKSGDTQITTFETTPKMSTYLLAFVYGELGYKQAKSQKGTVVRVYATPDNVKNTGFALETAVRCLDFYEDYFDMDYPLLKCDLTALPDFAAAGMENWGCITFSELALLVDEKHTSLSSKQLVAMVIAHELAHMWFGDLVTMSWWTDLWLNESFASWVEHLALVNLFPDWEMWTQFIVDEQQQAMRFDSLEHTRPIKVPDIKHPDEIRIAFDPPISYSKGASVINMLYHYLGEQNFQTGLRYYIQKHAYGNTVTDDLWEALATASHKPIKDFMRAWISESGFPLLRVNVEQEVVTLAQERFFVNPKHSKLANQSWPIPLLSEVSNVPELLSNNHQQLSVDDSNKLKFNRGQSGFYRAAYNSSHLERLGELIRKGQLSAIDRLGLLLDVVDCAKAGYVDTLDALHFLGNFAYEDSYPVWEIISGFLGSLKLVMNDEELREDMKPFILRLVAKQLKRLGWNRKKDESHFDRLLRPVILGLAAAADEPTVIKRCKKMFDDIKHADDLTADLSTIPSRIRVKRGGDVDPDLRGLIFSTAARLGSKKEFDKLLRLYRDATLSEEKVTIAAALTSFKQPELVKRALALIDTDDVRLQDATYWIAYSFLNRYGKQLTWLWLKKHWDWLKQNLGGDLSYFFMPVYSARVFSDESFLKDYKQFFSKVMEPGLERMVDRGIETITWQAAWKKRALPEIKNFFKAQAKN